MLNSHGSITFIFIVKAAFYETDTKFCTAVRDVPSMDDPEEYALHFYSLSVIIQNFCFIKL
jgi:hypothetical protein